MKRRIMSMLLAIVMVVGLLPGFTMAASATDSNNDFEANDISHECIDEDGDHYCDNDECGAYLSQLCYDTDKDHFCDVCDEWLTDCSDESSVDFKCDVCGDWMLPDLHTDVEAEAGDGQIIVTWYAWGETDWNSVKAVYSDLAYTVFTFTDEDDSYTEYAGTPTYDDTEKNYMLTITGLENDVTYTVGVEVSSGSWDGYGISSAAEATPYSATATAPSTPTNVQAVAGPEQITVSWDAPVDNGGAKILGYEVEYAPKGAEEGNGSGSCNVGADTTSVVIEDLDSTVEYEIKVCAVNAVGDGAYSTAVSVTPNALVKYNIWVLGEQFTEKNLVVYGDAGTATYDPDSNTLTLDNFTYEGGGFDSGGLSALIYTRTATLNMALIGENSLVNTDAGADEKLGSMCVYIAGGSLSIEGTGSLTAVGGDASDYAYGFYIRKDLTIKNCTVDVSSGDGNISDAIVVFGNTELADAKVTASGGDAKYAYGMQCTGSVSVVRSELAVSAGEGAVDSVGVVFNGAFTVEDSTLNVTAGKAEDNSVGIFAYRITPSLSIKGSFVTVVSGEACANSIGIYGDYQNPNFSIDESTVIVTSGTSDVNSCAIYTTGDILLGEGTAILAPAGGKVYKGNASYIANEDDKFATNVVIGPVTYTAVWQNDDGVSYEKNFEYGEVITIPNGELFEETFRKAGYTLTGWQGYTEGMTMPVDGVTFTAIYTENQYTVSLMDGNTEIGSLSVNHGEDATLPAIPKKDGYVGKWDGDGKNITADTVISVVYTKVADVTPDQVKPEDKAELEDAKEQLEDLLNDDSYTEDDKKEIQDAIDGIDDALETIENVENVEELIDKLPENITKNDEDAIKAAEDAYNALTVYEKSLVDDDAKKALENAKAALAELNKPADSTSPQTGDNSNLWLWFALLYVSGTGIFALTVYDRKRKAVSK